MNWTTAAALLIVILGSGQSPLWADELKARINKTELPNRITRPLVKPIAVDGSALKGALDPANFGANTSAESAKLLGNAEDAKLLATERSWQASHQMRDTGMSNVSVSVNIALCAPSNPRQREAWRILMLELGNPTVSPHWQTWQEMLCNAILEQRFLGGRTNGAVTLHASIDGNGGVKFRGPVHHPGGSSFYDTIRGELQKLADAGKFKPPSASRTSEVHVLIHVSEAQPL